MNTGKRKILGNIIAVLGLGFLLFNAVNYIFGLNIGNSVFVVIGLVMVVFGAGLIKKEEGKNKS